jgi:hypothetical protein
MTDTDSDQRTIDDTERVDRKAESITAKTPRTSLWLFWLVASDFLVARYIIARGGTAKVWFDTSSYSYRPGEPHRGDLVSLTGHAPRLWGSPALFALFHGDHARALAQFAIGTVAWLVLAWVVWRIPRNGVVKVVASGALLLLGLTAQVTSWDFAILSESLSISLGMLVLAGLLWWLHERSRVGLALLTVSGLWWTFTRPEIRLMVVALLAGLWIFALRYRARWRDTAIASGVLAAGMLWCSLIVPTTNQTFPQWSAAPGATLQEETFYHRLRERIYLDEETRRIYEERMGMPACPGLVQLVRDEQGVTDFDQFVTEARRCPQLVDWIRAEGDATSVRFALIAPGKFASAVWAVTPNIWEGTAVYGGVPQVLPNSLAPLVFPPLQDVLWYLVCALLVAFGAAVVTGQWRRNRALFVCSLGMVLTAIASTVAALFFVSADLQRQGIQETLFVRVCVVLLLALAADEIVARRQRRGAGDSAAEDSGAGDSGAGDSGAGDSAAAPR